MIDTVPQDGRSFFVRVSWARSSEPKELRPKPEQGAASGAMEPGLMHTANSPAL
jgi:hypothetical protein